MLWPAFTEWALALARGLASGDSGTWPWTDWTPGRWNGGRQELADKEAAEIVLIESYLPKTAGEE